MDVLLVLRPLHELERSLGELYQWFSEAFAGDGEAAFVFHRLFLEEQSHVRLIEYQRRLARSNPTAFGNVEVNLEEIQRAIARIGAIRNGGNPPELKEAVRLALEFETGAAEVHIRSAIKQANADVSRLLDSLGTSDKQHVSSLRAFAEKRGLLDGR